MKTAEHVSEIRVTDASVAKVKLHLKKAEEKALEFQMKSDADIAFDQDFAAMSRLYIRDLITGAEKESIRKRIVSKSLEDAERKAKVEAGPETR
jgi:hypothetical protein